MDQKKHRHRGDLDDIVRWARPLSHDEVHLAREDGGLQRAERRQGAGHDILGVADNDGRRIGNGDVDVLNVNVLASALVEVRAASAAATAPGAGAGGLVDLVS